MKSPIDFAPLQREFADYPVAELPAMEQLPQGFVDGSWHNDIAPCLINEAHDLRIWLQYPDPAMRELGGLRYCLDRPDADELVLASDDWGAIVEAARQAAAG